MLFFLALNARFARVYNFVYFPRKIRKLQASLLLILFAQIVYTKFCLFPLHNYMLSVAINGYLI